MIFLTVGTQFHFDRLIRAVDQAVGQNGFDEKIVAQVGAGSYQSRNFEGVESMKKKLFDRYLHESSAVIGHAGMGTIAMAMDNAKPLLVMPRRKKYGEVVNDHQVAIAREFEKLGHILVAYTEDQIPEKIRQLKSFTPQPRKTDARAVTDKIAGFLNEQDLSG